MRSEVATQVLLGNFIGCFHLVSHLIAWHAREQDINYRVHFGLVFHFCCKRNFKATIALHVFEIHMNDVWVIRGSFALIGWGWDVVNAVWTGCK
eukprot:scaffold95724_cov54-Attheya_sp.AAC.2